MLVQEQKGLEDQREPEHEPEVIVSSILSVELQGNAVVITAPEEPVLTTLDTGQRRPRSSWADEVEYADERAEASSSTLPNG